MNQGSSITDLPKIVPSSRGRSSLSFGTSGPAGISPIKLNPLQKSDLLSLLLINKALVWRLKLSTWVIYFRMVSFLSFSNFGTWWNVFFAYFLGAIFSDLSWPQPIKGGWIVNKNGKLNLHAELPRHDGVVVISVTNIRYGMHVYMSRICLYVILYTYLWIWLPGPFKRLGVEAIADELSPCAKKRLEYLGDDLKPHVYPLCDKINVTYILQLFWRHHLDTNIYIPIY